MDLLVLSRVETTTRTWAMTGVSSYLSRPPVSLLGKELLRFPICGAVVAVALASDDGTVGEDNRHGRHFHEPLLLLERKSLNMMA